MDNPIWSSATELTTAFRLGSLTPVEVITEISRQAERVAPALNSFQTVRFDMALAEAKESTTRWRNQRPCGPLDGVPITIKDTVDLAGWPTLKGSLLTDASVQARTDAPSVASLKRAGALIFAKTTTPEFAWKSLTQSRRNGATRTPWDVTRNAGGSTGGGAAAVAAGLGPIAHGTDGGGSLRMPPSYCGVVGMKPTNGSIPFLPQSGPSARMVVEGPIARNVADAALALDVMRQPDRRDPLGLPHDPEPWYPASRPDLPSLTFAYAPGFAGAQASPGTLAVIEEALRLLREAGATIIEVGSVIPPMRERFEPFWLASMAQALRSIPEDKRDLVDPKLVEIGQSGMSIGAEAIWQGLQHQLDLTTELATFHETHRFLITPTMLDTAPAADLPYHEGAYTRWSATTYVLPANTTGQPALTLPAGLADGLPVGLQIMARRYDDRALIAAGAAVEAGLAFSTPHPVLLERLAGINQKSHQ